MADYDYLGKGNDDGTILGQDSSELIGFWGITPVDQPAALTSQVTTITASAVTTPDYAIQVPVSTAGLGFANVDEALGFMNAVRNLQVRMAEVQSRLQESGIIAGGTAGTGTNYECVDKGNDDGTYLGRSSSALLGFWGILPVDQPAALTTGLTTVTVSAHATANYTITTPTQATAVWGFADAEEALSIISCVINLQTRMASVDSRLTECGLIAGGTVGTGVNYEYLDKGNNDGTLCGLSSSAKIGFWGLTPCDQPADLTTQLTTITMTASSETLDYALQVLATGTASTGGFKFNTKAEAQTFVVVIQNLQVRMAELEARLEECGIVAAN